VEVEVFGRTRRVRVAALVVDYTSGGASLVLTRDAARSLFGIEAADIILAVAEPGRAAALEPDLRRIARREGLLLKSSADVQATIARVVGGIVNSLWGVLALGFVVGSLGVANTVTMSVLEKTRTLGLLRAVGMTGRQVRLLVVLESVLVGLAGGIVGTVGGLCTAALIQFSSQPLLGHPVRPSFRPGVIALNLAAAVLVSALAAWAPARRAARLDLLEAVSAE
jgi:putative ABC transport system permease protein